MRSIANYVEREFCQNRTTSDLFKLINDAKTGKLRWSQLPASFKQFELQTKVLPTPQGPLPWADGGKLTLKRRVVMRADGTAAASETKTDFEIGGTAKTPDGGGLTYKNTAQNTVTTVVGGEIPAPPEKPAPAPPPPDKPAPDKPEPDKPEPEKPAPDKPEK